MKATTNKNDNKKRRRDDSEESIPESSKKAKVHAQRKFAQGAAFNNSPVITQIKDKIRPATTNPNPGPMLIGKCPNADDFLTYLCFRKYGIHPDGLTFTPNDSGEENSNSAQNSESSKGSQNNEQNPVNNLTKEKKPNGKKNEKNDGNKKSTPAVQALREKYQEQRLAKQKVSNVTKLAQKVKGKNMVRTRSSGVAVQEIIMVARKQATIKPAKPSLGLRSGLKRPSPVVSRSTKKVDKVKDVRAGLRSGGNKNQEKVSSPAKSSTNSGKKTEKEAKKPKVDVFETKTRNLKMKKPEGFSDFSSDDNEPLSVSKKPKMDVKKPEKSSGAGRPQGKSFVKTRAQINEMESKRETKKAPMTTPTVSSRPSRKTKEAATVYMEILTKKLVNSKKSARGGGGLSDESSSSSYLELPNVKRMEQRENEIKAKAVAAKAAEKKAQTENKTKGNKKVSNKKEEPPSKKEVKAPKEEATKKSNQISKAEAKESSKSVNNTAVSTKRGNRSAAKESSKAKSNTQEKNQIVFQPSRPSTRSRPLEESELYIQKKSLRKPSPQTKEVKAAQNKVIPEKQSSTKVIKKSKEKKGVVKGASQKGKAEGKQGNISKTSSLSSVSEKAGKQGQKGKKMVEKGKQAEREKKEPKDKHEKGKEVVKGSKKESSKGKKSGEEKQETKEPEVKKVEKQENAVSKRPTRHCSSVDKIWIDIDGFTSDEDDFIDESAVAKTRASAKRATRSDSTTKEKQKPEQRKSGKTEKSGTSSGTSKGKSEKAKETEKQEKQDKPKKEEGEKGDVKEDKESKKDEVQGGGKQKSVTKSTENKEKVEKPKEKEEKKGKEKGSKDEKPEKKEKVDESKSSESKKDAKSVRETSKRKKVGSEEGGKSYSRTRPVRQCSTGEKKWIETDSDSFSYYSTSEEENEAPVSEPSAKSKVKSSLEGTNTKENETVIPEGSKIATRKSSERENVDHFSESDEEPLEKKVVMGKKTTESKSSEGNSDVVGEKSPGKAHREVPGLHPLKKIPSESQLKGGPETGVGTPLPKPNKSGGQHHPNVPDPVEPKPPVSEAKTSENRTEPIPTRSPTGSKEDVSVVFSTEPKSPVASVPNRADMLFHPVRRDEETSNNVMVTFGNVPYQPMPQMVPMPCSYHIKPMSFPPPREPISTHGLDLLSEVALPTTPKEKFNSQTERIEKWLKDSLAADHKTSFRPCQLAQYRPAKPLKVLGKQTSAKPTRPDLSFYNEEPGPGPATLCSHPEHQKFGELELLESQKLLKRNIFAAEMKHESAKVEPGGLGTGGVATIAAVSQSPPAKKAVTSVQDLLKLQKERREMGKSPVDNSPHLKNCKCNNCVVKKGWFKNKPVPSKTVEQKTSPKEESVKPFQSLTKAFSKTSEENEEDAEGEEEDSSSREAISVTPMSLSLTSSRGVSTPSSSRDGKGVLQQKKMSFLERMKEREKRELAARKAKPNAFSPSHESSVYAFEPERDHPQGMSTPFKRKARDSRTSSTSNSRSDDEALKICEDESMMTSSGAQQQEKTVQDTSGSSKASQSASIAVQVNLDSEVGPDEETSVEGQDGKSIEISTQTEVPEEDSDSPLFYIPLQQKVSGVSTSSEQRLIQGVALKLGTEGPMGPNQRVIMKAKLVTKAPDSPSIKAVVMPQPKRLFDQKINNPPIGTVQPTARKPPAAEDLPTDKPVESDKGSTSNSEAPKETMAQTPKESSSESSTPKSGKPSPKTLSSSSSSPTGKGKEKSNTTAKTEASEDHSAASSSSKGKKAAKQKSSESSISPSNSTCLPFERSPSKLVEAPTFYPTEKDFQDPFEFFDRIRPAAEKFGLCRIVPPSNFKPDCKVSDDMRFTAYNQYVHRMFHRWGPNIKEMMAIKKYLVTQSISLKQPPWIGGIEVDLPRLYQSVQNCGGLMKVMEKKKWHQVADMMKIPKAAQDRVTKLDDIYCKYLLPYDTLSQDERQKLFDEVEKDWLERQKKPLEESQDSQGDEDVEDENYIEECEECVVKGRNMALNQFYRIARNTMSMWFRNPEPSPRDVETEFWKHVSERNHHVCVHSGSIDSRRWGYGFPIAKNNSFSRHPWNLKVLTNNSGSVLRSLGPVMGVTVPTIHVGMVFTAFCWYRDPHGLPWIEYLHTGAPKIWYGISDDKSTVFQEALAKLLPRYIKDKRIWLPSDTAMIPPNLLVENGVSLCQTVQEPGQFILVFPRAFTSSICTGYLVSESVYFAQPSWLSTAEQVFKDIQDSCEPTMFSLEKLLFSIATDSRSSVEVLKQVLPMVWHVRQKEIDGRKTLSSLGLKSSDRLPSRDGGNKKGKGRWTREEDGDYECEVCRMNLYVSLVTNSHEEGVYCLPHAIDLLTQKRHQLKYCKLMYTYTQAELNELVDKLKQRIESKSQKKIQSKSGTSGK